MKSDVLKCSSCGNGHIDVEFNELITPAVVGEEIMRFVGQCPTTMQPIFMNIKDRPTVKLKDLASKPCPYQPYYKQDKK